MENDKIKETVLKLLEPIEDKHIWRIAYTPSLPPWSQWECVSSKKRGKDLNAVYKGSDGIPNYLYVFIADGTQHFALEQGGALIQKYLEKYKEITT